MKESANLEFLVNIPKQTWNLLSEKKIYFGHQSVGENIIDGLKEISKGIIDLDLKFVDTRYPLDFNSFVFAHSSIGHNEVPLSKCDEFRKIMESGVGDKVDIAFFKFCFVDIGNGTDIEAVFKYYCETISYLEAKYPKVAFITFSVPLTIFNAGIKFRIKRLIGYPVLEDMDNINRCEFNKMLVNKYGSNGTFFDLALFESTNMDGTREMHIEKGKQFYSLVTRYSNDGGHLNEIGRKMIAQRLLLLLIRSTVSKV